MRGRRLLIFGASGHGKVVADAARAAGWDVLGFADDDPGKRRLRLLEWEVVAIGAAEALGMLGRAGGGFVVAIGDSAARARVFARLRGGGGVPVTVVHPAATVASSATLGDGTVVFAGCVVNADAVVGRDCILNTGCSIDHDCDLGDHVHVSPGARLGGGVRVGAGAHVGIGASVIQGIRIGEGTVVGAGAVVVRDLPDRVVAYGCPARPR